MVRFVILTVVCALLSVAPVDNGFAGSDRRIQIKGAHVAGYQGWFRCPQDDARNRWTRWFRHEGNRLVPTVDMWPDLAEVNIEDRCDSGLKDSSGNPVWVFSSLNKRISLLHAQWAFDYNIDALAMQRFVNYLKDPIRIKQFDSVLKNMRESLKEKSRGYFLMYDISGGSGDWQGDIISDIARLEKMGIFDDKHYVYNGERPLVAIWGFGVPGRPGKPSELVKIVDQLISGEHLNRRFSVMGGVTHQFRKLASADIDSEKWTNLFKSFDIISPWYVGAIPNTESVIKFSQNHIVPDKKWSESHNVYFMPTLFPGFSWVNLKNGDWPENQIARDCGKFYAEQIRMMDILKIKMAFTAMFDELDEATAIFKTIPSKNREPKGIKNITLDEDGCYMESDYYLKLASQLSKITHSNAN